MPEYAHRLFFSAPVLAKTPEPPHCQRAYSGKTTRTSVSYTHLEAVDVDGLIGLVGNLLGKFSDGSFQPFLFGFVTG